MEKAQNRCSWLLHCIFKYFIFILADYYPRKQKDTQRSTVDPLLKQIDALSLRIFLFLMLIGLVIR